MSASVTLSSTRIHLRRWRGEDRVTFAAMNTDARVMEFFRSPLSRAESDAMVEWDRAASRVPARSTISFSVGRNFDAARCSAHAACTMSAG